MLDHVRDVGGFKPPKNCPPSLTHVFSFMGGPPTWSQEGIDPRTCLFRRINPTTGGWGFTFLVCGSLVLPFVVLCSCCCRWMAMKEKVIETVKGQNVPESHGGARWAK